MPKFELASNFNPTGDQPKAINQLVKNLKTGAKDQVLLGVTGSGKTFTMANVIAQTQKPTLIISHNKTLAAQLYQEFKEFFPQNSVNYFVSYYDYYQPEAYIPQTDTYIEKDAKINQEIDRLRHAAAQNLLSREDVIIIASVSCIYNIGLPSDYLDLSIELSVGQTLPRQQLLRQLTDLQFERKDINFNRGAFRVRGESVEIWPATGENIITIELKGNEIAAIFNRQTQITRDLFVKRETKENSIRIYPAKFWVSPKEKIKLATVNIEKELKSQLAKLKKAGKILEAERLRRRTNYDLEMMREVGYCFSIENYSRHLEFRAPGTPPYSLLDYLNFPATGNKKRDFLLFIDESHMTVPQIGAMYEGDKARKQTLIDFGFRLPSALDNRPLKFSEFENKIGQTIYVSATPGKYELAKCQTKNELASNLHPQNDWFFIRHGQSEKNVPTDAMEGNIKKDIFSLTEKGIEQVKESAQELKKEGITKIFSSDFLRTRQTAQIIAQELGLEIIFDSRLREVSYGRLEGTKSEDDQKPEIQEIIFQWKSNSNFRYPSGGESQKDITERMQDFYKEIDGKYKNEKVLIVTHGGPIRCFLGNAYGLTWEEIEQFWHFKSAQIIRLLPKYEFSKKLIAEQLIRPTGLIDPKISVRPTANQIPDLINEIKKRVAKKQRVLVTTLTKRMAEDLSDFLKDEKIKTSYLHSEIKTLERPEILKKFREGIYDVVVGVNLLREGLDLPEVSLVAILDADKEGFLRGETALVQTIGRASRHLEGQAIMYADKITRSMKFAIDETTRRRQVQEEYNKKHGITPQAISKAIHANLVESKEEIKPAQTQKEYLKEYLNELKFKMELANRNLQFDEAMRLKEEMNKLKIPTKK